MTPRPAAIDRLSPEAYLPQLASHKHRCSTSASSTRSRIPREARDGLMRAWLEILKERHPNVTWIARDEASAEDADPNLDYMNHHDSLAA